MIHRLIRVVGLTLLAGCAHPPVQQLTLTSSVAEPLTVEPRWVSRIGEGSEGLRLDLQPLIDGELIYGVAFSGDVVALDRRSGKVQWQHQLPTHLTTAAVDGGDRLFIGGEGRMFALSKQGGALLWEVTTASEVIVAPLLVDDQLLVRSIDGTLMVLDPNNGAERWRYSWSLPSLTLRGESPPLVVDDMVLIGTASGHIIALGLAQGELRWESPIAVPRGRNAIERLVDVDAPLLLLNDNLVVASAWQQGLSALSVETGRLVWKRDLFTLSGGTLVDDLLILTDHDGMMWALDPANGATFWRQGLLAGHQLTAPVTHGPYFVLGDDQGTLQWFKRGDGSAIGSLQLESWREHFPSLLEGDGYYAPFKKPQPILSAPVVVDEWLYAIDLRGYLVAYTIPSVGQGL